MQKIKFISGNLYNSFPTLIYRDSKRLTKFINLPHIKSKGCNKIISEILKATISLFVILDIVGLIPIYLSFFKNESKKVTDEYVKKTVIVAAILMFVFLIFGSNILNIFSVSIENFKIAGGIILLIVGIKFVLGLRFISFGERKKHSFAIVPFTTPLLVGPGTITYIIILMDQYGFFIPSIAIIINLAIIFLLLGNSKRIFLILGSQGSEVITRIMGLLITAIAVGFIRSGLNF